MHCHSEKEVTNDIKFLILVQGDSKYLSSPFLFSEIQKKKSRDAARQRRGQQNDEFTELASQLPVLPKTSASLDRLCVMRLSNSFVKMKHIIRQITGEKIVNFSNIFLAFMTGKYYFKNVTIGNRTCFAEQPAIQ